MSEKERARPASQLARNLWGWFAVCVWITGVPEVVRYAVMGIKQTAVSLTCATANYNCPGEGPAQQKAFVTQEEAIDFLLETNPGKSLKLVPNR